MGKLFKLIFGDSTKNQKKRIYDIEIDDKMLDKKIMNIIMKIQEKLTVFREHLESPILAEKDEDVEELYQESLEIKENANHIYEDVQKIIDLEIESKDYFIIKDDSYLYDKKSQLKEILESLNWFLGILQQRPSAEEFKDELFKGMELSVEKINRGINTIIKDDDNLSVIYKKISEF